jgi:hypothetical protein
VSERLVWGSAFLSVEVSPSISSDLPFLRAFHSTDSIRRMRAVAHNISFITFPASFEAHACSPRARAGGVGWTAGFRRCTDASADGGLCAHLRAGGVCVRHLSDIHLHGKVGDARRRRRRHQFAFISGLRMQASPGCVCDASASALRLHLHLRASAIAIACDCVHVCVCNCVAFAFAFPIASRLRLRF